MFIWQVACKCWSIYFQYSSGLYHLNFFPARKSVLNIYWKNWCRSWSSNILATWCEELTHCKRPWCWKRLKAGGEGGDRGWDGWMALPSWWTWVWASAGSWWRTARSGVLQSMGLQRVGHDWMTELNWTELKLLPSKVIERLNNWIQFLATLQCFRGKKLQSRTCQREWALKCPSFS